MRKMTRHQGISWSNCSSLTWVLPFCQKGITKQCLRMKPPDTHQPPLLLLLVVSFGLFIQGLYRWRGWKRFRSAAMISPSLVVFMMGLAGLISSPPTPAGRLKKSGRGRTPLHRL